MSADKYLKSLRIIKDVFRSLSLKTQLLLILLFVLAIALSSLTVIYARSEQLLLDKVTENIDDITNAIQVSVQELTYPGDTNQRLNSYVGMLKKRGIKEISIIGDDAQVIASSNPTKVGTVENPKNLGKGREAGHKKDIMITAKLGEESGKQGQRVHDVIMPVSIKGQNLGYIHISMILDDYQYLQRKNHFKRLLSTLFAFGIGIIVFLILAHQYTDPVKKIANAARKIAEGKPVKIRDNKRRDEIGVLVRSFNDMVDKLDERKELEEKLKKTEQLSMIGHLASGIAHEVRNPLNFLLLSVGHIKERLAEENVGGREDISALLDNLTLEIYRVNELINNFLFLGKQIVLKRELISPEALVKDALYMVRDKVRDNIEIETDWKDANDLIYCDREYMRICLINLLLNSVQAIEDKGTVRVEFGSENGMSCISVTDNGKGVPDENRDRIFEPYYSTKKLGIGLGLAITKRFIEEHGGAITLDSIAGERTTITIRIPKYENG
jgi:signal transduction histidine kinase